MKSFIVCTILTVVSVFASVIPKADIDYKSFLSQHDMTWDVVPHEWAVSPYSGNGNIGFTLFQYKDDKANQVSLNFGRHDYYDHRLPYEGRDNTWIYTCRLPLGRFQMESIGTVTGANLKLDLFHAELTGTITTTKGSYSLRGFTHSTLDNIYVTVTAENGESVKLTWIPAEPKSSVRSVLERGGGPKGGSWDYMKTDPYPAPPAPVYSEEGEINFCKQILHEHRGETTTAWTLSGAQTGTQTLRASIHHSFPESNSLEVTKENMKKGLALIEAKTFESTHQAWWADYYAKSFITLNDPEKEGFYWIQMYKLGSAMRENGPILDLMGPWYEPTFWPMVWGDLNVQLQYWTQLTSNRLSLGNSLPNNVDKYAANLVGNLPEYWKGKGDLIHLGTCFPQNFISQSGGCAPDMLCWLLHNYWLQCKFEANDERLKTNFYTHLRKTMNTYIFWIGEQRLKGEGEIELPVSWSPEYPAKWDANCNFTIGLLQWALETLLDLNAEHNLQDELAPKWQNILDRLPSLQLDENGIRIAKNTPFDIPHRHYSHLLAFYPLANITPDTEENAKILRKSVDHWLEVTRQKDASKKANAMPVTGYTATGAASMYAWLKDSEMAYYYLDFLIKHQNVSPTTMYAEGRNPVIESPLSFCTSLHDMILQSYGRKDPVIRVLPACPSVWPDLAFNDLRAQGAFIVSAKRKGGVTQFVNVKSLAGKKCIVETDIKNPVISIDGKVADASLYTLNKDGSYTIQLQKDQNVTFSLAALDKMAKADLTIQPIPVPAEKQNRFGYSARNADLPGHTHYKKR